MAKIAPFRALRFNLDRIEDPASVMAPPYDVISPELQDELYAITSSGGVIRTFAKQVRKAGRQTKGVRLMNLAEGDSLLAIARNADEPDDEDRSAAETAKEE